MFGICIYLFITTNVLHCHGLTALQNVCCGLIWRCDIYRGFHFFVPVHVPH